VFDIQDMLKIDMSNRQTASLDGFLGWKINGDAMCAEDAYTQSILEAFNG